MHLGIIQTAPIFGDKESNRREIERLAEDRHADLWIMPELALTGYEFRDRPELASLAEEIPGGETCEWLVKFCAARDTHAVIGLAERTEEHVYNSCILAGPEKIIGHYRKLHLFDAEHERFDPGNLPLPVYDLGFARVGLMICFDWRYPEAARTLMLRGAQLIAHPSNLVAPYCQAAMVTRALENRAFFATVNRIGSEDRAGRTVRFTGRSV
ncbi:acyltransferase, partial [bacterium]|nr:acyltransferase [bacterium]